MGRKKKKIVKPWCWYCNRDFDDEKILIQHQKAKHFKCHICHKKLYTGPGLQIHCMQVHKENIDKVPNAVPGRHDIEIEIYGMEGIPEADLKSHQEKVAAGGDDKKKDDDKKNAQDAGTSQMGMPVSSMPGMMPGMMPGAPMMGGMMPGQMPMPPMPPIPGLPGMPPFGMMPGMSMPMLGPMPPMMRNMGPGMMPDMMRPPIMRPPVPTTSSVNISAPNNVNLPSTVPSPSSQAKPLFPSAAATTTSDPSMIGPKITQSSGPVMKAPPQVSTPQQQSSSAAITSAPTTVKAAPTIGKVSSSSATSKIMHPDEDISLEEIRSNLSKYARLKSDSQLMMGQRTPQGMAGLMGHSPITRPSPPGNAPVSMGMGVHQMSMQSPTGMPRGVQMGQSRPMYQSPGMMQQPQQRMQSGPRPAHIQQLPHMMRPGNESEAILS
ncbi:BUB3-interacting and GLEBS motif-containing protein ZNF207-like [Antedon mediterranea]|uniref:BUB3-interacting and GLEBS motif-containing protein ZNF207-like n=1 Tax=Antedon mediterranea TaxID=105859 RepID=UPI003AF5DCE0